MATVRRVSLMGLWGVEGSVAVVDGRASGDRFKGAFGWIICATTAAPTRVLKGCSVVWLRQ